MSDLPTGSGSHPRGATGKPPTASGTGFDEPPRLIDVDVQVDQASEERVPGTGDLVKQQGGELAEDAREQAKEVGETARAGAVEVVEEAKHQATDLIADARQQLHGQARAQTDHLGEAVRDLGDKLHALADGRPEEAGQVVDYADRLADQVERIGGRVSELGFDGTVDELQRYARRRPAMFLLGAGVAGFAVARLGRGAKDAQNDHEPAPGQTSPGPEVPSSDPAGDHPAHLDVETSMPTPSAVQTPVVTSVDGPAPDFRGGRP